MGPIVSGPWMQVVFSPPMPSFPPSDHSLCFLIYSPEAVLLLFPGSGCGANLSLLFTLIHRAFESIVDRQPDVIAVEHDGHSFTYLELEKAVNVSLIVSFQLLCSRNSGSVWWCSGPC